MDRPPYMEKKAVYLGWGTLKDEDEPIIFLEFAEPASMLVLSISEAREMVFEMQSLLDKFKGTLN